MMTPIIVAMVVGGVAGLVYMLVTNQSRGPEQFWKGTACLVVAALLCFFFLLPGINKLKEREARFIGIDLDKNEVLTLEEFGALKGLSGKPEEVFQSLDTDHNGLLSKREFCDRDIE